MGTMLTGGNGAQGKYRFFEAFWRGEGPCPLLFARPHLAREKAWRRFDLVVQHGDAEKLLEESLLAVEPYLNRLDDGLPAVRPDLGTTLLPSGLGMEIVVQPDQQPWLRGHLSPEAYLAGPDPAQEGALRGEVPLAEAFYRLFRERQARGKVHPAVRAYAPDTQGVFDLSHLVIGSGLFLLLADDPPAAHRVQARSLALFLAATRRFKGLLGEAPGSMVHGHGMAEGVWFPGTGARISEDSCTLIGQAMIEEFCLPYIREAVRPFGRGFLHFCGRHMDFLRQVCAMEEISTLNLGNPEMVDPEELFALLGRTGTAYLGHLPRLPDEGAEAYLERLAELRGRNGVRLILVADCRPRDRQEEAALVRRWHRLARPHGRP